MIVLCDSYGQIGIGSKNLRAVLDFESSNSQILISNFSIFFHVGIVWTIDLTSPHMYKCTKADRLTEERINPGCAGRTLTGSSRSMWAGHPEGCQFLVLAITTGKKSSCRLSGGLVLAITTGKKKFQSSVWRVVLLWFWRLRPEKKSSSRLSGRLSVFGSGDYDWKKKSSSSH